LKERVFRKQSVTVKGGGVWTGGERTENFQFPSYSLAVEEGQNPEMADEFRTNVQ
jgi:hypothetical protein